MVSGMPGIMIQMMNEAKTSMRAMRIHRLGAINSVNPPLEEDLIPVPQPADAELLIRIHACATLKSTRLKAAQRRPVCR